MPTRRPRTSHRSPCPGRASRDTRSMGLREPITAEKGGTRPPQAPTGSAERSPEASGAQQGAELEAAAVKLCSAPRLSKACAWVAVILWPGVAIGSCRAEKFKNLSRRGHSAITCHLHRTTSPPPSPRVLHGTPGASLDPSPSTPHEARPCRGAGGRGARKAGRRSQRATPGASQSPKPLAPAAFPRVVSQNGGRSFSFLLTWF